MPTKKLSLLDEGSWALMIEESNVRALHRYHGSMAGLDIDYYLSIGSDRYFKGHLSEAGLERVRAGIVSFLLDDALYTACIARIRGVLATMHGARESMEHLARPEQFDLYCELLCEYIAYYNSVITDTFYTRVFEIVDAKLPSAVRFAARPVKDALFATDNNDLVTHAQTVDMWELSRRQLDGEDVGEDIRKFVQTYRSTTISSGSPDGMSADEVREHLAQQTPASVRSESAFLENLHFRYAHAETWSARTASTLGLDQTTTTLVHRSCELSHLKIQMREEFQELKVTVRSMFLTGVIADLGKQQFDYMLIEEIAAFLRDGRRVQAEELARRRTQSVFELAGDEVRFLHEIPEDVVVSDGANAPDGALSGDVLIGSGTRRYRVRKVQQHEEGLTNFNDFVKAGEAKDDVAVVTNVLRPHLVPKLRKFGALLTQYGGYTSHASVLCRELGIDSVISIDGLLDAVETDDVIEVDFDRGVVTRLGDVELAASGGLELIVDLGSEAHHQVRDVGGKAANLIKARTSARIARGFVVTSHALARIDEPDVQRALLDSVAALGCARIVIRSSHESEDRDAGSYAGLFESFVDVDATDSDTVLRLVRTVHESPRADSVAEYAVAEGDMSVIVQEMIAADVSGVVMTSNPFSGLDYLVVEYVVGDLSYLMQGDVTPLSAYLVKTDVISGANPHRAYPAIVTQTLERQFRALAEAAIDLESHFARRVQIEWGIRDDVLYIFQVRPY